MGLHRGGRRRDARALAEGQPRRGQQFAREGPVGLAQVVRLHQRGDVGLGVGERAREAQRERRGDDDALHLIFDPALAGDRVEPRLLRPPLLVQPGVVPLVPEERDAAQRGERAVLRGHVDHALRRGHRGAQRARGGERELLELDDLRGVGDRGGEVLAELLAEHEARRGHREGALLGLDARVAEREVAGLPRARLLFGDGQHGGHSCVEASVKGLAGSEASRGGRQNAAPGTDTQTSPVSEHGP